MHGKKKEKESDLVHKDIVNKRSEKNLNLIRKKVIFITEIMTISVKIYHRFYKLRD